MNSAATQRVLTFKSRCLVAVCLFACVSHRRTPAPPQSVQEKGTTPAHCAYEAQLLRPNAALEVAVQARCEGWPVREFALEHSRLNPYVSWIERPVRGSNRVSYRVRLGEAGIALAHLDLATTVEGVALAPLASWLASPVPALRGARATLRVATEAQLRFDTGLSGKSGRYELSVGEIRVGSYGVFGGGIPTEFELPYASQRLSGNAPPVPARIQLAVLPGRYRASQEALRAWVIDTATAVSGFYSGFPARKLLIVIVPVVGQSGVSFGKLLPAGGAGIVLKVGEETRAKDLYRDWILTHELFHLGVPSFSGEGKWLDEGLATYFEPIIRYRAGWLTEDEVWSEFARDMPQGLLACETYGLARERDYKDRYWGGALFSLLADIAATNASECGLQGALVAALLGGAKARSVWSLERYIKRLDRDLKSPMLQRLAEAHVFSGSPTNFEQQLAQLGIKRSHFGVELDDQAQLAHVRRRLLNGVKCKRN